VKGVGLTPGVQYVGRDSSSIDLIPGSEATLVSTYRVIDRGSAGDHFGLVVSRV
jgi:hypothetical protein